jgi:Spy/CpxP family protein refolding chaperone
MQDMESEMNETAPSARPRRRVSILLIVSLCLNIVLVPVVVAVVVRAMHRGTEIGAGGVLAPRSVMRAVPAEDARIQKIIDAHTDKIHALRKDSFRARKEAFAVLGASDYSPGKFAGALNQVAVADSALERESISMMAESLAALTPAERQVMVDQVKRRNQSWFWRMFRPRAARE